MIFIIIKEKKKMVIKYNYRLQTLIVKYMKLKENFCFNKDIFDFVECQDNSRM